MHTSRSKEKTNGNTVYSTVYNKSCFNISTEQSIEGHIDKFWRDEICKIEQSITKTVGHFDYVYNFECA